MNLCRRRLLRAGMLLAATACAQMDPPPGGPEDRAPPTVVSLTPDSMAVLPGWDDPVVVTFSERISERQVEESVMVSPRTSPVAVDRGSRQIRVTLRRGWEPGRIYHVTIRPEIQDLFNNRVTDPVHLVFSTGPAIPQTRLSGIVVDRITGQPEEDARVEAIRRADSLVYAVPSDSAGRFVIDHVPEGEYLLRAFPDPNRNRLLDPFEKRDSTALSVTVADAASAELSLVLPDTTPPQLLSAAADAQRRVELRFDDYLDASQPVDSTTVSVIGPDGVPLAVSSVTVGRPNDAPADTIGGVRALPARELVAQLAEGVELVPEEGYRVTAAGIRNVVGLPADVEGEFTAPEPPPEAAPADPDTIPAQPPEPGVAAPADPVQQP